MTAICLSRGPNWPAVKPYIWKKLDDLDHFVAQVPYETVNINTRALAEYQPLPWKIRNPFAEYLHGKEMEKFNRFLGNILGFIATKSEEIDDKATSGGLKPNATDLRQMSEKLA